MASFVAGATLPFAITLVANVFQSMITYDKEVQSKTQDGDAFLHTIHKFGIMYSCVGVLLFVCAYLGSALMNITAINQVNGPSIIQLMYEPYCFGNLSIR